MTVREGVWASQSGPYVRRTDPYGRTVVGGFPMPAGKRGGWPRAGEGRGVVGVLGEDEGRPGGLQTREIFQTMIPTHNHKQPNFDPWVDRL